MPRAVDFRRSEVIRDARYDDERIAYEREYLKKADHGDSVSDITRLSIQLLA